MGNKGQPKILLFIAYTNSLGDGDGDAEGDRDGFFGCGGVYNSGSVGSSERQNG